jgi:hypothetical protein
MLAIGMSVAPATAKTKHGGTPWRVIVEHVIELQDAIDRGDRVRADNLLARIPTLGHNTYESTE